MIVIILRNVSKRSIFIDFHWQWNSVTILCYVPLNEDIHGSLCLSFLIFNQMLWKLKHPTWWCQTLFLISFSRSHPKHIEWDGKGKSCTLNRQSWGYKSIILGSTWSFRLAIFIGSGAFRRTANICIYVRHIVVCIKKLRITIIAISSKSPTT